MLEQYYREYEVSFEAQGRLTSGEEISRQRYFLTQLADARSSQEVLISNCQKVVEDKKSNWHKAYLKQRALSELIERIKNNEDTALSRQEEKFLDGWTTQTAQRSVNQFT